MKFISYAKAIIENPKRAFQQIIKDKNTKKYIIAFAVFIIFDNFLLSLFSSKQVLFHRTPVALAFVKYFLNIRVYYVFLGVPLWLIFNFLLHGISRLFSKRGSYKQLILITSFIGFIIAIPIAAIRDISYLLVLPIINIVTYPILGYGFYLNLIAIDTIYAVNKQKAFVILLIQLVFIILLFALIGFIYFIIFVTQYYK